LVDVRHDLRDLGHLMPLRLGIFAVEGLAAGPACTWFQDMSPRDLLRRHQRTLMLVVPWLPAALATGSLRSRGRRRTGRICGRRARRVAGVLAKPGFELKDSALLREDGLLLGLEDGLLLTDTCAQLGILSLQLFDAVLSPIARHDGRSIRAPSVDATMPLPEALGTAKRRCGPESIE